MAIIDTVNMIAVINGTSYYLTDIGTQSIDSGTWITTTDGQQFLVMEEYAYVDDGIKTIPEPEQPFWSKQGKTRKGGRRKY